MKRLLILFFISTVFPTLCIYSQTSDLSGTVTNENGKPVSFVNLSLSELSISTFSNSNGKYSFNSIPQGTYHISITRTGYLNKTIDVKVNSKEIKCDIEIEKSLIETPTIDVTSSFNPTEISNSTFSVTSIGPRTLSRTRSENIATTIQNVPGINNLSTGNAIGKPVIRGLTSQSVIMVHDGVKNESQQWGDEHAPEISVFDLDRIEILRGPASLIYGADGIGGVINIISKPLQFSPKSKLLTYGSLDLNGFSMNTEGAGDLMLGIGTKDFSIKGFAGYRKGKEITTPDGSLTINTPDGKRTIEGGKLSNSANNEFEGGIRLGYNGKFEMINAEWQIFNRELQLHDDPVADPDATGNQKLVTNHFEAKGSLYLSKNLQLEPILSYETQIRKEFKSIEDKNNDAATLNLDLKIFQSDLRLHHSLKNNISGTVGLSISTQDNKTLGKEKLIPNYNATNFGSYLSEKIEKKYFAFSVGVRYDNKTQDIKETIFEVDGNGNPTKTVLPRKLTFNSLSESAGFVYKPMKELNIYTNVGSGWRPPSEFDLYADGVHEGTGRFDRGLITVDSTLNPEPERSLNIDLGIRIRTKYFNGEISFFRNLINNFIYPSPTGEIDSISNLPVYDIKQAKSTFIGFEYSLQFHPVNWAILYVSGDFVETKNKVTNNPLPFTPPSKTIFELKIQKENIGKLYNPYINLGSKIVAAASRTDPLEASVEGYTLFNAGIGFDFVLTKSIASIDFSVSNLTDKKYVDHLSRYRYYAMNPGRSFNLKISVPFQF